jgi:AcrR family transcriptional regulator
MPTLPKNVRIGRNGRIGILKRVPQDLWQHPHYHGRSKIIERSTRTVDEEAGIRIAVAMLADLDRKFAKDRADLKGPQRPRSTRQKSQVDKVDDDPIIPEARSRGGETTRREILAAAMKEFAEKGLKGARIDDIAAQTRTTKPMIYYHFGSKERLYAAVMEEAYGGMRSQEQGLHLDELPPDQAMQRLVEVTFDHHARHPEYVRLVTVENMERARHISGLPSMVRRNAIAITTIRALLERGEREGVFRPGINPWHLHLLINSFCFLRVSNRYTWRAIFEMDLWEPNEAESQRQLIVEAVLRYVRPGSDAR